MTLRNDVNVFKVPFTMTVTGFAYVIANSQEDAIHSAKAMDLGDFISVDENGNVVTIDNSRGFLVDFDAVETVGLAAVAKVRVDEDYDPTDHPDYDPGEHDEEGDAEGDPGAQALAKSHKEGGTL